MAMVSLSVYGLLAVAEMVLLALILAGVGLYKWRNAQRSITDLRQALRDAAARTDRPAGEPAAPDAGGTQATYADCLRKQLKHSGRLLGENTEQESSTGERAPEPANDSSELVRRMLAARAQFLRLELEVEEASDPDPESGRRALVAGMQALLAELNGPSVDEAQPGTADANDAAVPRMRSEETKLREQIGHLRSVIDNQHGVMQELRHLLEEHGGNSEGLQEALHKLSDVETQAIELRRCLGAMGEENARLRQANSLMRGTHGNPDAEMLRDLVDSQQRTISKLQDMLHSITPDSDKARELADAINRIQRSNTELNSCVMVLEDENNMLRGELETLQGRLADIESRGAADTEAGTAATPRSVPEPIPQNDNLRAAAVVERAADREPPAPTEFAGDTEDLLASLFGDDDTTSQGKKDAST
ncbi:MAG: hypothetical protein WCZ87_01360 [Thiohalobacteraceae bacterium]